MAEKKSVKERAEAVRNRAGKHGNGFVDFIRTQGVVGLAVGLAIGTGQATPSRSWLMDLLTRLFSLLSVLKTPLIRPFGVLNSGVEVLISPGAHLCRRRLL